MDLSNTPAPRHDGWTPERRTRFLDRLAQDGNVLAACALVGLSREAAYRLRRRDPVFARAWAAAQALAREAAAQALATRAIDGIEEDVWYRGEVVGTRRRYDNRLLLAHIARLDKLAEANLQAEADMERFDELLARVAGVALPADLASRDPDLPAPRTAHVQAVCDDVNRAHQSAFDDLEREREEAGELPYADDEEDPEWDAVNAEYAGKWDDAYHGAIAAWDAWFDKACATVDRLLAQPAGTDLKTLSNVSTSPHPPRNGEGDHAKHGGGAPSADPDASDAASSAGAAPQPRSSSPSARGQGSANT
jgi:hypothetical protein